MFIQVKTGIDSAGNNINNIKDKLETISFPSPQIQQQQKK